MTAFLLLYYLTDLRMPAWTLNVVFLEEVMWSVEILFVLLNVFNYTIRSGDAKS